MGLIAENASQGNTSTKDSLHIYLSIIAIMTEAYIGKWQSDKLDKFDDLMKVLEVSFVLRKAGANAVTYLDIQMDGDYVSWDWKIAFKSGVAKFKLGEEFDEVTPDGRKVKSIVTVEGDKLVWIHRGKPHDTHITRTIEGDTMTEISVAKDVTCTRTYKRTG